MNTLTDTNSIPIFAVKYIFPPELTPFATNITLLLLTLITQSNRSTQTSHTHLPFYSTALYWQQELQ